MKYEILVSSASCSLIPLTFCLCLGLPPTMAPSPSISPWKSRPSHHHGFSIHRLHPGSRVYSWLCFGSLPPSHTSHHLLHGCFHHPLLPGVLLISYLCNLIFFPRILAPSPLGYEGRMQGKKMRTKDARK